MPLGMVEPLVKYHPGYSRALTVFHEAGYGTVVVGQFDWGGLLLKSNGGAQCYTQRGWQSREERKGRSVVDCETDRSNRRESGP